MRRVLDRLRGASSRKSPSSSTVPHSVLIVCDKPNWSYASIAAALTKYNNDPAWELSVDYAKGNYARLNATSKDYDACFFLGWQVLADFDGERITERLPSIDYRKAITGIHSHHAWDNRQTQPDKSVPPAAELIEFLKKCRAVNVVSRRLYELFLDAGLPSVTYTPNGVDVELFKPETEIGQDGPIRVGFSGTKNHDWRKGITQFIEPACDLPEVELKVAMPQDGKYVPLREMSGFYNDIDVYVCASSSEGFSLSVLEASACGRPVISTRVGGCVDLIEDGVNGFLVDRDVDAIREKIEYFAANRDKVREMGAANRRIIEERWSWEERAPAWLAFIQAHLQ